MHGCLKMSALAAATVGACSFEPFRLFTWNILASVHTHWNSSATGAAEGSVESAAQAAARHRAVVRRIIEECPDVCILQEVDTHFMPLEWQGGMLPCGLSLTGFTPHRSFSKTASGAAEGVAILLRDGVWMRDREFPKARLVKERRTGWKSGLVLHARQVATLLMRFSGDLSTFALRRPVSLMRR